MVGRVKAEDGDNVKNHKGGEGRERLRAAVVMGGKFVAGLVIVGFGHAGYNFA